MLRRMTIPKSLTDSGFRFIKVIGKVAIEKGFVKDKNYAADDPELLKHLENPDNGYGVLCNNGLIGIDADSKSLCAPIEALLPPTFTVRTGKFFLNNEEGGKHFYFICPGWTENLVLGKEGCYGHIQAHNKYLVGPGSPHYIRDEATGQPKKSGYTYKIEKDLPVATITPEQLKDAIRPFIPDQEPKTEQPPAPRKEYKGDRIQISFTDFMSLSEFQNKGGGNYQGPHPGHSSKPERDLSIDTNAGLWKCFSCDSGGDALMLYATLKDLISCDQAKPGALQGQKFIEVKEALIQDGIIKSDTEKEEKDDPDTATPEEIAAAKAENKRTEQNEAFINPLPENHIISRYIRMGEKSGDAYPEYHLTNALVIESAVVGRNPYVYLTVEKVRLNIWGLNLGVSTLSRKTTAHTLADLILSMAGVEQRIPQDASPEGFIESLALYPGAPYCRDEYGDFLAKAGKKYSDGLKTFMCMVFNCPDHYERRLKDIKKSTTLKNVYMPMMANATPDSLAGPIEPTDFNNGFIPRHLPTWPERPKKRMDIREPTEDDDKEKITIAKDYAEIRQYFSGTKEHRIRISPEALTMYNKWCADIEDMATNSREKSDTGILLGRLQIYVIKLAALIEIGKAERITRIKEINKLIKLLINKINDNDKTPVCELDKLRESLICLICSDSMSMAINLVQKIYLFYGLKFVNFIRQNAGKHNGEFVYEKAVKNLKDGEIGHSELMQLCKLSAKEFNECIRTLIESDRFLVRKVKTGKKPKVFYIPKRSDSKTEDFSNDNILPDVPQVSLTPLQEINAHMPSAPPAASKKPNKKERPPPGPIYPNLIDRKRAAVSFLSEIDKDIKEGGGRLSMAKIKQLAIDRERTEREAEELIEQWIIDNAAQRTPDGLFIVFEEGKP
jgi:hypothetical protein